ncbi:MAG: MAPEG family protein [Bdellovibrionales bacterium]
MAASVFYTGSLILYQVVRRLRAVKENRVSGHYYRTYSEKTKVPEDLLVLERHVDNQFQLPALFLVTMAVHLALNLDDLWTLILAWSFIGARLAHSYVHLSSNRVLLRARVYALGWLVIWVLWIRLLF